MLYTQLGQTGLIVSRLSFGAMTFTMGDRSVPTVFRTEADVADALIGKSLDAGVNFFDTADVYAGGESETLLGKALASRRQQVVIATKAGMRFGAGLTDRGLSRHHLLGSVDGSLKRLGTDYIDVYIVHRDDPWTPLEETLSALDDIVRSGKVRYIGFSNWPAWKVSAAMEMQRANGWAPFTHGQMKYSLLEREVEHDVAPMMRHYGLGLTAWSPLSSGFLSGKYSRETLSDPDNRLSSGFTALFDPEPYFDAVEVVRAMATKKGVSVAQLSLAWLLSRDVLTSIILGASKLGQLEDNLGAVDVVLSDEDIAQLDALAAPRPIYPHGFLQVMQDTPVIAALARRPGDKD